MEKKSLKKVMLIAVICVVALSVISVVVMQMSKPNGNTLEEREELLRENRDCKGMSIATETQIGDYIICGIYKSAEAGIAVFEQTGNGYKLQRTIIKDKNQVIISPEYLNGKWYQLVWFNGAETKSAEVTITNTDNNETIMTENYDVSNGDIIAICEPDNLKNFSVNAVYHDADGNTYK